MCWPDSVTKGIAQTIEMAIARQVVIVTSTLTLTEALATQLTKEQRTKFTGIFSAPYVQLIDLDRRISGKAAALRDFYDTRKFDGNGKVTAGSSMAMGDAIQLATAIHLNVPEFQTLDGSGTRQRRLDILKLNGNVAGARLVITAPAYVAPPPPLTGPQVPIDGAQKSLFGEQEQTTESTDIKQEAHPGSADVRPGSEGHSEDQTGVETPEGEAEDAQKSAEGEKQESITKVQPKVNAATAAEENATAISPPSPVSVVAETGQSTLDGTKQKLAQQAPPESETHANVKPAGDATSSS
jgi:hypothetical protein